MRLNIVCCPVEVCLIHHQKNEADQNRLSEIQQLDDQLTGDDVRAHDGTKVSSTYLVGQFEQDRNPIGKGKGVTLRSLLL